MLPRSCSLPVVLFALSLAACATKGPARNDSADVQAITVVREREVSSLAASTIDTNLALLTSDAVMMPPGMPMAQGTDANRKLLGGMTADYNIKGQYTDSKIEVVGDVAIERYAATITMTPKAGGAPMTEHIKGIHIYRRQPDGSWKIEQDVWNADEAPPAPAPAPPSPTTKK